MTSAVFVVDEKPCHVKMACADRSTPSSAVDFLHPRMTMATLAGGSLRSACSRSQMRSRQGSTASRDSRSAAFICVYTEADGGGASAVNRRIAARSSSESARFLATSVGSAAFVRHCFTVALSGSIIADMSASRSDLRGSPGGKRLAKMSARPPNAD